MVCTLSIICRAHVKQSHTQLLPQQTLLQDVAIAECQCCQPGWAGTGWGHSHSRGAVHTLSVKALCKCGLGSRCSKTYLYSGLSIALLAWALKHSYCQIFPSARYAAKRSWFYCLQAESLMQKHDSGTWVSKENLEHCNTRTHVGTKLAILTLSPAPSCLTGLNAPTLVTGMSFLTIPRTGAPKNASHNPRAF